MADFFGFLRHAHASFRLVRHCLLVLFALLLVGAAVIAQVETLNYGDALYLTLITGLTVGYGDLAPATVLGRIVSVLVGLIGLVFFGVIVAIANRALSEVAKEKRQLGGS